MSPRSLAVPGMNWATPCAPAGLTTAGRNELSRQMSLVKNATGSPSALAEASTIPHRVAIALSLSGPASACAPRPPTRSASAASAILISLARAAALPMKAPML